MELSIQNLRALTRNLQVNFRLGIDNFSDDTAALVSVIQIPNGKLDLTGYKPTRGMLPWVDERRIQKLSFRNYSKNAIAFEETIQLTRSEILGDSVGMARIASEELGRNAQRLSRDEAIQALINGDTALGMDETPMFSDAHTMGTKTVDNAYALALSADNYATVRSGMIAQTDENNRSLGVRPTHLFVAPALEGIARSIVAVPTVTNGAANVNYDPTIQIVVVPEFSATEWYLLDLSKSIKPIIWGEQTAPRFDQLDQPTSSEDAFMRGVFYWGAVADGVAGYGPWQYAFKGND